MKLSKQKTQKVFRKLENLMSASSIQEKIVFEEDGVYCLFGKYTITKIPGGYLADKTHYATSEVFSQMKHAVAWATLDNLNRIKEASRVKVLDKQLTDAKLQIQVHQRMSNLAKDIDNYIIYKAKLQEDIMRKSRIVAELDGFVESTKAWQYRAFQEASK